jgi:hypothetical protein
MKQLRTLLIPLLAAALLAPIAMSGNVAHASNGAGREARFDRDGDGVYDMTERMQRWQERKQAQAEKRASK